MVKAEPLEFRDADPFLLRAKELSHLLDTSCLAAIGQSFVALKEPECRESDLVWILILIILVVLALDNLVVVGPER